MSVGTNGLGKLSESRQEGWSSQADWLVLLVGVTIKLDGQVKSRQFKLANCDG